MTMNHLTVVEVIEINHLTRFSFLWPQQWCDPNKVVAWTRSLTDWKVESTWPRKQISDRTEATILLLAMQSTPAWVLKSNDSQNFRNDTKLIRPAPNWWASTLLLNTCIKVYDDIYWHNGNAVLMSTNSNLFSSLRVYYCVSVLLFCDVFLQGDEYSEGYFVFALFETNLTFFSDKKIVITR
jgi:hypothetical protein